MKKYWILPFLVVFLVMGSCSSGDDGGNGSNPDDPDPPATVDRTPNLQPTGSSANDILSNDSFDRLEIQIGYVTGFRPRAESIANFEAFLRQHTFKDNIEISFLELDSPDEETLTTNEIASLESDNRTLYNNGSTVTIYIYFADAPSDGDDEEEGLVTLGAVYLNTSMVIFESTIRNLSAQTMGNISVADIETATLNHEFGHLFGLVDLGTEQVNIHEDHEAPNHCIVEGCLMRAALQFGSATSRALVSGEKDTTKPICALSGQSVLKMLDTRSAMGVLIPGLDPECILDIQGNGAR
ncbi:MAG: hypothetical protein AAGD88_01240 [Bacteroidota bacterium]